MRNAERLIDHDPLLIETAVSAHPFYGAITHLPLGDLNEILHE